MKNFAGIIFVLLVIAVLAVYLVSFQVRETESVVVTRFGEPRKSIGQPGLYWKWPRPIERVHRFDSRLRLLAGTMEETTTHGGDPIIVTTYIIWKIDQPLKFLESVGTVKGAQEKLRSRLRDKQNTVIGRHYFSELINTDPAKIRFAAIEREIFDALAGPIKKDYGIEVTVVGIKQLGVDKDVTKNIFARMRADRRRIAETTVTQGEAEAKRIKTDADTKRSKLLDLVETQAKAIRGAGDAKAARYYRLLAEDPDFAMFLRDTEALKKILKERSTILISADTETFELLKRMPDIKPAKRGEPKK